MLCLRTLGCVFLAAAIHAQQTGGTLRGVLSDDSGAVIPAAAVSLSGGIGQKAVATQVDGSFSFPALPAGPYKLNVSFPGFTALERSIAIEDGKTIDLHLQLKVTGGKQEITVTGDPGPSVSVDPENNASALVLKGSDLDALPDDPDELNDVLQALAGPAAGPNGGQLFVDGFSGGQLPPKSSIREIRINQNPFSAEYDRLGIGRIEILTKPGSDKFHGGFGLNDSDGFFNSRNPYATNKADYSNRYYNGNVSGPLGRRASFFLNFDKRTVDNDALITADTLDPVTLADVPVRSTVVTPRHDWDISPRIDYQLSAGHTLSARYEFDTTSRSNNGIGQYSLPSRAYSSDGLHLTETAVLSPTVVNETRFGYNRGANNQYGDNSVPAVNVADSFLGGSAQVGRARNLAQHYEIQNNTSMGHKTHTHRFGLRARHDTLSDYSPTNFGGSFTFFGVGNAPVLDGAGQAVPGATTDISSLEQYRRTLLFQRLGYSPAQVRALGGGASQFSIAGGSPLADVSQTDLGVFALDDWRMKPNFTLSLGLRYETQTKIHDWRGFAPRVGIAWAPKGKAGKPPKTVIRAGSGVYYDRVAMNLTLQQLRFQRNQPAAVPGDQPGLLP